MTQKKLKPENGKLGILNINSSLYHTRISSRFANRQAFKRPDPRTILSFIPGTVLDILVSEGQIVKKGDNLMILDAMKMQNNLKSPFDGKVKTITVKKGDKVSKGAILLLME